MAAPKEITKEELRKILQEKVGKKLKIKVEEFENWVGEQRQEWVLSCTPVSVPEIQAVVTGARYLGLSVRCAASTHSWSPVFPDRGQVVIHVKQLTPPDGKPKIQLVEDVNGAYPEFKLVKMTPGTTTGQFKEFQLNNDVCLPTNVILREVTMGGVVAGGCHGAGWDMKSVSDFVVAMTIVSSDGEVVEYSEQKDAEMMKGVKCNLGLWGVMVDITFKVEPTMPRVKTQNVWMKVADLFYKDGALNDVVKKNWSVELFWFPFNAIEIHEAIEALVDKNVDCSDWDPKEDEVLLRLINRTDTDEPDLPTSAYKHESVVSWLVNVVGNIADGIVVKHPQTTPGFLRSQIGFLKDQFEGACKQEMAHAIHFRDHVEGIKVQDMEWCFNVSDDCSNVVETSKAIIEMVRSEALEGRFPMNLPLEMRFIQDSDVYMVPASSASPSKGGTGHTVYIEVLCLADTPGWEDFMQKVADVWSKEKGARPHWCKGWMNLEGIDDFLRKAYQNEIPLFLSALERSGCDPAGMFFNERLQKIFYPQGHPGESQREHPYTIVEKKKSSICEIL